MFKRTPPRLRSQRAQCQQQRRMIQRQLRAVMDAVGEAIIIADEYGVIRLANRAAEKLWGYAQNELLEMDLSMLMPHPMRAAHTAGMHRYRTTGVAQVMDQWLELQGLHRDGHVFDLALRINEVRTQGQQMFIGAIRDVSLQKQAMRALEEQNRLLALARDEAIEASRLKSEFLAVMSHEVRTPLNGVLGMAELLLDTDLDPVQRDFAQIIADSGSSLLNVLNDILDFAKIEAGKLLIDAEPFALTELLGQTAQLYMSRAEQRSLRLHCIIDPRLPAQCVGDANRLRQVLLNLLSNACKFTTAGSVTLSARLLEHAAHNCRVEIKVADTGIGIPEHLLERLFEPFTQADSSTTRRYGGTGLGLAIAQRLIVLMDGSITVSSREGRGTVFTIELPLLLEEAAPAQPAALPPAPVPARSHVLLVEDHAVNRAMMLEVLERLNCAVDVAEDGAQALELYRAAPERYQLILMDCLMPTMDGYAATESIRALELQLQRHVPIIALTANALNGERERCLAVGMDDYVSKPITLARIRSTLNHWLNVPAQNE